MTKNNLDINLDTFIARSAMRKYQVAERAGISQKHLSAILGGRARPTITVALKLAKVLNTKVEDIFELAE